MIVLCILCVIIPSLAQVFHMCWTASRADKLTYLSDLGMWYLASPDAATSYSSSPSLSSTTSYSSSSSASAPIDDAKGDIEKWEEGEGADGAMSDGVCENGSSMLAFVMSGTQEQGGAGVGRDITEKCCLSGGYFK